MYFIDRYKSLESFKDILFSFLKPKLHLDGVLV